jgi:hypothetical protein
MRIISSLLFLALASLVSAQDHSHRLPRALKFPDIPGYKTLKCDFHQHTVFSDGSVWPDIRVMEALMDGLDAISLTEHLEYQPHKQDIPHPDRNRSYELAKQEAKNHDLLIVRGSEITRKMPPGHNNAIFIQDANAMLVDDSVGVFKAAKDQGAFIFWNHPNWTSQRKDGIATLTDMHKYLIREGLLHGIEVVNDHTYSDEALQIALDNNLTIMGTSDIHKLIDWEYKVPQGGHRPITLVLAKDRSIESIKEALMQRRSIAYFKDMLIGRPEHLNPLVQASLVITKAAYGGGTSVLKVTLENRSSTPFILRNTGSYTLHTLGDVFNVPAAGSFDIEVKTVEKLSEIRLNFEVLNAVTAPGKHPNLEWSYKIPTGK